MIKLIRTPKPKELAEKEEELREKYRANPNYSNAVWNKSYIKEPLLAMSYNKCCYCETKLDTESSYLHVEHFKCKSIYHDLVVEWDNLLPSCGRCNFHKGDLDVDKTPIIDPTKVDPKEHLYFSAFRYYHKNNSHLGHNTIDSLKLNDREKLNIARFLIGDSINIQLNNFLDRAEDFCDSKEKRNRTKNSIIRNVTALLEEVQKDKKFSAVCATVLLQCPDYIKLKEILIGEGMWTQEMEDLECKAIDIALL